MQSSVIRSRTSISKSLPASFKLSTFISSSESYIEIFCFSLTKLKFSEKVEFKEILNKNDIQDLTETETAYFGERIQRSCPHELQFDRDSLSIVKTNNIVEKYKLKWQDKKLFIYQKPIDKWEYCGEKDENGRVILNIGFYIIKNNNDQRTFMAIGQEYNLISYSELMNQDFLSIIWLKRKYTFE